MRLVRGFGEARISEAVIEIKLYSPQVSDYFICVKETRFMGLTQPGTLHEGVKVDGREAGL